MADTKISAFTTAANLTGMVLVGESGGTNFGYTTALFDARYATLTGATFTGNVNISQATTASAFVTTYNTVGAGALFVGPAGNTNIYFDNTHGLYFSTTTTADITGGTFTSGVTKWSMDASGNVNQVGKITTATSAAAQESIIIPHGAAPTTPTNGSIWTTTSGLFGYINGTTQQYAPLASPGFTGVPTAPTAAAGTNSTQLATTAYVVAGSLQKASDNTGITAGFTSTAVNDGTKSTGTYTPSPLGGNMRYISNGGAFTFAVPSTAGDYSMIVQIVNSATAGAITWSGFPANQPSGALYNTTSGNKFNVHITKLNGLVTASLEPGQ